MKPLRKIIAALDEWQRRTRGAGVPYAVVKKFGDDNANLQVLALAWYGFTAIFPLLLVVVTILGFVGQKSLGTGVITALQKFPVIGTSFPKHPSGSNSLHGSTIGLVIGLLGLIYGAPGVTQSAQQAMATVWDVPQTKFTGFLPRLGRSLAGLIIIGGSFLINALLSTYVTGGTSNYAIRVPVLAGLLIINSALYFAAFTVLTPKVVGPRGLWPGAILGGIAFTALITVGTGLLTHELKNASNTYGTFGSIIGIVTVLLLLAKVSIYGAELNPVLARKLYPRALPMGGEPTDADFQVLIDLAHAQQRRDDQVIGVGFGENAVANAAADAGKQAKERPPA
jgi:uncharacterized BrkB/YihY/UPF0761 family membrane protein